MSKLARACLVLCWGVLSVCPVCAADEPVLHFTNRKDTRRWFEQARFGIFIHWDPRSNVKLGSFDPDIRPQVKRAQAAAMFDQVGPNTYKWQTWNPVHFDPSAWVELFREAGARYATFTTMHAFGFCNFDSPFTDFDVLSTAYKKDIVQQLAQAAKGRLPLMWYYNAAAAEGGRHIPKELWPDWYKSLWRNVKTYDELRAKNILHLITNTDRYGKVAGIWWDGGGKWDMREPANRGLLRRLFQAQPWLIMSPRCGHPDHKPDWRCSEQRVGAFKMEPQWEMCVPIESSVWFWAGGKENNTKDVEHCLKLLVMCATRDGNLLLNISPMPDGRIQPLQASILRGMGRWLRRYGESIYSTRGGPYRPGPWGGATRRGNTVYLHVLQVLQDGQLQLPPLPARVVSASMLTGGTVRLEQDDKGLRLFLDDVARQAPIDRIVKLTVDRNTLELEPIRTDGSSSLASQATAVASSEFSYKRPSGKRVVDAAANVVRSDGGPGGYWTAQPDDQQPWLALQFQKPVTFRQVYVVEKHTRIRKFEIQAAGGTGQWQTLYRGERMNYCSVRLAQPVTASRVRVVVLETANDPPQIRQFDIFP